MPKLPRILVRQFGASGVSTNFGQFGSKKAAAAQTSQDPSVIMQLAAWINGWTQAAVGARFNPYIQDMNGFCLVVFYFLANLFERGIADYSSTTTYYMGALVQDPAGSGQVFYSLTDNNIGNALPLSASNAQWRWLNPPVLTKGASATLGSIPKVGAAAAAGGYAGSVAMVDSAISDDGTDVIIALPLKFSDNTIQTTAAEPISSQNVVTGSRVMGNVYQNTTSKVMFVSVSVSDDGATPGLAFFTDDSINPTTEVVHTDVSNVSSGRICCMAIVLPGNYYKATGGTLDIWTEWS